MLEEFLVVGEILRPQGVRGDLKVRPLTDDPDRFFQLSRVKVRDKSLAIHCLRVHDGFAYIRLEGVYSRESAEDYRGELIYVHRDDAVKLPEDTEFICDLIGCCATDTDGNNWGTLKEVLQNSNVDVYVFEGSKGEMLVPALKRVILEVNVSEKRMLLDAQALRETAVLP